MERWLKIEFLADMYKGTDVPLLKFQEEDYEALENDQLTVQGMMASRYIAQFEKEVSAWQVSLVNVADVFTTINEIQRTWSYLEPLFIHSDEVKRELPVDAERFAGIDVEIKDILMTSWETKNIKEACNVDGLLQRLEHELGGLDLCKKSLADFLDGRRRQFPRYYFTSEADLLDILSNGSVPEKVMIHTSKIYLSTKVLKLSETERTASDRPIAVGYVADVGKEYVPFEPPVPLEGKVEIYMQTVLDAMKSTLFENLKRSILRYAQMERKHWVMAKDDGGKRPADPAQIILLTLAINYVQGVEAAFDKIAAGDENAMVDYNNQQIEDLADLVRLTGGDLDGENRTRIMVCITMDSHGRDIVQKLIREKVSDATEFQWQSQLKHKYRETPKSAGMMSFVDRDPHLRDDGKRAEIAICDAILPYDYEYLGNGPRLVITPLTDRIYVTATQALNLMMGCAPAGPAGTGKTESTKDLASALAKCCYVFNCSPEMDYKGLGNIFKGLGSSGAWGCFDEFNRLIPEVLSVCTVQFKAVCDGIKAGAARVTVEGDEVSLDPTCGAHDPPRRNSRLRVPLPPRTLRGVAAMHQSGSAAFRSRLGRRRRGVAAMHHSGSAAFRSRLGRRRDSSKWKRRVPLPPPRRRRGVAAMHQSGSAAFRSRLGRRRDASKRKRRVPLPPRISADSPRPVAAIRQSGGWPRSRSFAGTSR